MTPVLFPFEHIEVTISGTRWLATGTTILKSDLDTVYTGAGWIQLEQLDRLDSDGELDYEDFPRDLWTLNDQLALLGALEIKINNRPDIEAYFVERQEP